MRCVFLVPGITFFVGLNVWRPYAHNSTISIALSTSTITLCSCHGQSGRRPYRNEVEHVYPRRPTTVDITSLGAHQIQCRDPSRRNSQECPLTAFDQPAPTTRGARCLPRREESLSVGSKLHVRLKEMADSARKTISF